MGLHCLILNKSVKTTFLEFYINLKTESLKGMTRLTKSLRNYGYLIYLFFSSLIDSYHMMTITTQKMVNPS